MLNAFAALRFYDMRQRERGQGVARGGGGNLLGLNAPRFWGVINRSSLGEML